MSVKYLIRDMGAAVLDAMGLTKPSRISRTQLTIVTFHRFLPRDRSPALLSDTPHRHLDAVGIVEDLDAGLSLWAEPALVVRVEGVAIQFDHPAIHNLGREPASTSTQPARAGVPLNGKRARKPLSLSSQCIKPNQSQLVERARDSRRTC